MKCTVNMMKLYMGRKKNGQSLKVYSQKKYPEYIF